MGVYSPEDYVLCIVILLASIWLLVKYFFPRIKLDKGLIYALIPYMFVGIFIRLLVDVRALERSHWWNITPGVYILTAVLVLVSIAIGFCSSHFFRIPYWYVSSGLGILILLPIAYTLSQHLHDPERILYPVIMASGILYLVHLVSRHLRVEIFQNRVNLAIVFSHLLDGCATFIAYNYYGFGEEHLLPIYLIETAGNNAFIMVPVKLALILVVIYYTEKWYQEDRKKDEALYRFMKLLLFVLGFGPGLRDTLLPSLV